MAVHAPPESAPIGRSRANYSDFKQQKLSRIFNEKEQRRCEHFFVSNDYAAPCGPENRGSNWAGVKKTSSALRRSLAACYLH
jgi:hypothetical protein